MNADLHGIWSLFEPETDTEHGVSLRLAVAGDTTTVQVSHVTDWELREAETLTVTDPATVAALTSIVTAVRNHGRRTRHEQRLRELTGNPSTLEPRTF